MLAPGFLCALPAPAPCTSVGAALLWDAELYTRLYPANATLPATALYTADACAGFPVPATHAMAGCALEPVDACHAASLARCPDSVCVSEADGRHRCECPDEAFRLQADGSECTDFGVEMHVTAADAAPYVNLSRVDACASAALAALRPGGFLAVDDVSLVAHTRQVVSRTDAARTWRLSFRIPLAWLDVDRVSSAYGELVPAVEAAVAAGGLAFAAVSFNDASYESTAAESNGLQVLGYEWLAADPRGLGWEIRLRIPAASDHHRVLYVSRRADSSTLLAPNDGDLPCQFFEAQDQCCLQRFAQLVHVPVAAAGAMACPAGALPTLALDGVLQSTANRSSLASHEVSLDGAAFDVTVFLSYEAVKTNYATEHVQQGGSTLAWFLGVARVRTRDNFTAIQGAHRYFSAFVGSTYTLTTAAGVARVAAPRLDIEIVRVQDAAGARFFDFARVRVALDDDGLQFAPVDAIPATSALYKIQLGVAGGAARYMCAGYDPQVFAAFQAAHPCALQAPPCVPQLSASGRALTQVFPLGVDGLAATLAAYDAQTLGLTQNLYLDFFLRLEQGGTTVLERIQTSTEILRTALLVQCAEVRADISLGSMLSLDMIGGLLQNASDLNRTVSYFRDVSRPVSNEVCDQDNPRSICMQTPKLGMGSMTYVLLGSEGVFAAPSSAEYHVRVSSMFSIYFLSELKKIAVRNLLRAGRAFVLPPGQTLEHTTQLVPSEELLALCPMHVVRGNYGCISRFEVEDSVLDFETASIAPVPVPVPHDANATAAANLSSSTLGSWVAAGAFGGSVYMQGAVEAHADLVVSMFQVNNRFRTAFVQSPTLPWTPSALAAVNVSTRIDAVQDTFAFMLVTMDSSRHEFHEAVYARVRIPSRAPVACAVLASHPYLQNAFVDVWVSVVGGSRRLFSVEPDFVVDAADSSRCQFPLLFDLPYQVSTPRCCGCLCVCGMGLPVDAFLDTSHHRGTHRSGRAVSPRAPSSRASSATRSRCSRARSPPRSAPSLLTFTRARAWPCPRSTTPTFAATTRARSSRTPPPRRAPAAARACWRASTTSPCTSRT